MARREEDTKKNRMKMISDNLQVPSMAVLGMSHIEIMGNNEVVIEGCKGVLEYSDDSIRLNLGKNEVQFSGTDLVIKTYINEQVLIDGNILTIDFS
ncbi:MAG: YabP/YqfC family sporulation protein [Oscillospiraceae bacterium]|nr:YabP/YqfC family sporulation protein [Oscillospiraceae bacterium]